MSETKDPTAALRQQRRRLNRQRVEILLDDARRKQMEGLLAAGYARDMTGVLLRALQEAYAHQSPSTA